MDSRILLKLIKNGVNKIATNLHPFNPNLVIMEGTVESIKINVRKAKFTLGKKINMEQKDEIHSEKGKKNDNDLKKWFCQDYFLKIHRNKSKFKIWKNNFKSDFSIFLIKIIKSAKNE